MAPKEKRTVIDLPALDAQGKVRVMERLEAVETDGVYRLVHSPGLVEGLAAGDEIELTSSDPSGYQVVSRSGNLCVWFNLINERDITKEGDIANPGANWLRGEVERIGGWLDGGTRDGGTYFYYSSQYRVGEDRARFQKRGRAYAWHFMDVWQCI